MLTPLLLSRVRHWGGYRWYCDRSDCRERESAGFIATLVMMLLLRGVTRGIPTAARSAPDSVITPMCSAGLVSARLFGIPAPVWLMIVVFAAACGICCITTRLGRYIYALGGTNPQPACPVLMSIKLKSLFYCLCGLLAALASVIEVARLSSAQPMAR